MVTTGLRVDPQDMSVGWENTGGIGNTHDLREVHPLQPLLPLLAQSLAHIADESAHMMVVTDADGRVLWRDGNPDILRVAHKPDQTNPHTDAPDRTAPGTDGPTRTKPYTDGPDRTESRTNEHDRIDSRANGPDQTEPHADRTERTGSPTDEHDRTGSRTDANGRAIRQEAATRREVHVYSEEALMRVLHVQSRSAAPIIDPDTDRVLGCVDISGVDITGTARSPHPATVALVCATAKLAETQLALRMHERDERLRRRYEALGGHPGILLSPTGRVLSGDPLGTLGERLPLPAPGERMILRDGRFVLLEPFSDGYLLRAAPPTSVPAPAPTRLRLHGFLGEGSPTALVGEHRLPLSLRHAEILALLALHPSGLNAEQLSFHLYGDDGNPVTIRVEIHRLRAELGNTIGARPYRLTSPIEADFLELRGLLASSDPASLARVYAGPLLPRSESPEIRRERDEFEVQVRTCLLLRGSPDDLWAYAQTSGGREDFEILQRLATTLPATDHRAAAARARLRA
ncbi:helix-turn-helix domain-containing protein [Nonomuraea aurantiaca]|uniref:helix-turn-helix domain-containing protein n=1 Tax=Nonomuraea aurantiaca TaxID=2878562 RepID=UPI001CD9E36E|nr:helix-turn-helix domain-containing protein [Nonomuraea aurantiaca]MCA2229543.1 transcriptional regulator [Nonomuraea aurantiaca]